MEVEESTKRKCVTLTSSDDEEKEDGMPKITSAVSLRGCSSFDFNDQPDEENNIFYPECEIEENNVPNKLSTRENNSSYEENTSNEKKRVKLTHLPNESKKTAQTSAASTSSRNTVDTNKLALQESLFKTKELFDTFLRVCQDVESSPEMQIVVNKLERVYSQVKQDFLGSEKFQMILESETEKVNVATGKPWLNLKLVLDEMKFNKKSSMKLKLTQSENSQSSGDDNEPVIECPKKRRHLKKLEKTLRALNLKIKKLEEREVDFNDDDSAYIKLDRYREQFTKIYNKVCEIRGKLPDADRPYLRKVSFAGTRYPHINRCIEKYYNKHREFPDFQDIKKLVVFANKQENIEMLPGKIHQMATDAFKEFGEMLKRLRQYDDYDIIVSYLDNQVDPARNNTELQEKLNVNALQFRKKEQEIIDKFAATVAGLSSDSNDSKKHIKKKRRILISKPSTSIKSPLNSESSDESTDESDLPVPRIDSDDESTEEEEKEEETNEKAVDKGKRIIGKERIVKSGKNANLSVNKPKLQNGGEVSPSKDNFAQYLGLHSTPSKNKSIVDSESEIICMTENNKHTLDSDDSSKSAIVTNHKSILGRSKKSELVKNKCDSRKSEPLKSVKRQSELVKNKRDSSKSEPLKSIKRQSEFKMKPIPEIKKMNLKSIKNAISQNNIKSNGATVTKLNLQTRDTRKVTDISDRISLSSDSDNESAGRTSGNDNLFRVKPCRAGHSGVKNTATDKDTVVILSEDVIEEATRTIKNSNDSDSDDVCILSQNSTEVRKVAIKRTSYPPVVSKVNKARKHITNSRRPSFASSTPIKKPKLALKRKESNQLMNGVNKMLPARPTVSHTINGAERKIFKNRNVEAIPLIELD